MTAITQKTTTKVEEDSGSVEIGQWYWVKKSDDDSVPLGSEDEGASNSWFGCVTHIGSNYVQVTGIDGRYSRVHANVFLMRCRREAEPTKIIGQNAESGRIEIQRLMREVEAITARLGVGAPAGMLTSGGPKPASNHALAKLDGKQDVGEYKTALVRAKKEELPALFEAIADTSERLTLWMKAETLPMRAQVEAMKESLGRIDDRIFHVELYAGLTETVTQIKNGSPADMTEKIRLLQRRHYMDEECLAQYETGGMEFKDIDAFDAWLVREDNLDRLLPFPRCVVAFQVRRKCKERPVPRSFVEFFTQLDKIEADKLTFLYIRNGEQVYRLDTQIEFGETLFPDTDHDSLTSGSKLWARVFAGEVQSLVTDNRFQGLVEEYKADVEKNRRKRKQHKRDLAAWRERKKAAEAAGEDFREREPRYWPDRCDNPENEYEPYDPDNIYYDDIHEYIEAEMRRYNRIGIILQGLLDRSPVLHPHPPWKIWSEGGFETALELIYDSSRALVGGEKPDFEAYHAKLNESLETGSVTIGQYDAWHETLESDRYGYRHAPYGNPGPPVLARIERFEPRKRRCNYAWMRAGQTYETRGKQFRCKFACSSDAVFNVSAYKPGDFRVFFNDPRTRAEYIKWAPWLLEAEEYQAGNRKVEDPPEATIQKPSFEGQLNYRRTKERKRVIGKLVKNRDVVTTRDGSSFPKGTHWIVVGTARSGGVEIDEATPAGEYLKNGGRVIGVQPRELLVVGDPKSPRSVVAKKSRGTKPQDTNEDDE